MKWNLRERMQDLREGFVNVVRRHPLELLLLLALTVTLVVDVELRREPDEARLLVLGWGALLLLVVNLLTGRSAWHRIYWVAWAPLVPLFLWKGLPEWIGTAPAVITLAILTPLALLACRRAVSNDRFVADALVYLRAAVLSMLFAYVAYGLFEAILWSAAYIFGFTEARWVLHLTTDLFLVTQFLTAPTLFLMMLDRREEARMGSSRVLEVLVNWIITPAVILYAVILYVYLLKILFTWSLPEGGVAYLVFGFTITTLVVKALRLPLAKRIFDGFYDRFSLVSLPIVVLFWVGVARRVGEYGLTVPRIYLLICGGVMTLCILLFLSRRTGRYLWVVLFAMIVFAAVAYIPALEPERAAMQSQTRRVERLAASLGRLDAQGHLLLAPASLADTVRREEFRELYEALEYVERDSAAFARFGLQTSDDLVDVLPEAMRDYVRWGMPSAVKELTATLPSIEVYLPHNAEFEVDRGYSRCYVNLTVWNPESCSFENDTLRFLLGTGRPVLEVSVPELLEKQLAASGFDPSTGAEPTREQALRLLDYRDERCRILFEQLSVERRDSADVITSLSVHSLWLR
ncbi:DUF4153 domain-containing protein [Alistipes sp.]|uniref:DUF4153 domain-containing protein n=1 Tax=Alistipes sp. TaxID=1872444 RepID=UPI003A83E7EA